MRCKISLVVWGDGLKEGNLPSFTDVLENYVSLLEGAEVLRIHPESLRRLLRQQGKLKGKYIKYHGKYLIEREALLEFKFTYSSKIGRKRIQKKLDL